MKLKIFLKDVLILSLFGLFCSSLTIFVISQKNLEPVLQGIDHRVVKCMLPLKNGLIQNSFVVAPDLQTAKKELFNSKKGLYFEGRMFIKTNDFKGNEYIVPFSAIECDSLGYEVNQAFEAKS